MKEYIEREKAIALFYPVDPENDGSDGCTIVYKSGNFSSSEIEAMLSDLPTDDVAEVRRGRWITPHWCNSVSCANCSECGFEAQHGEYRGVQRYYKLCPNCGALMKEDEHEVSE